MVYNNLPLNAVAYYWPYVDEIIWYSYWSIRVFLESPPPHVLTGLESIRNCYTNMKKNRKEKQNAVLGRFRV
jgi:hypothetical protein